MCMFYALVWQVVGMYYVNIIFLDQNELVHDIMQPLYYICLNSTDTCMYMYMCVHVFRL